MDLQPGDYRYSELAEICGVSRTTSEKFKDRYGLLEVLISYNGREVKGVRLTEENCAEILGDIQRDVQGVVPVSAAPLQGGNDSTGIANSKIEALIDRVLTQSERLVEVERELASKSSELVLINREMEARNNAIVRYKDQEELNRRLEKENVDLKNKIEQLEKELSDSKKFATSPKPRGWFFWQKQD